MENAARKLIDHSPTSASIATLDSKLEPKSLLGSRFLDFWLVGGASLVAWLLLTLLAPYKDMNWAINRHITSLPAFSSVAALFINYPHFMVSYKLSYGQGWAFARRNWFQMLAVPVLLFWSLGASWLFLRNGSLAFSPFAQYTWAHGQEFGRTIIAGMVKLLYFTVGWHYSKQMFGIMMVYAKFDNYRLTEWQRRWTKATLFGVWFVNYVSFSGVGNTLDYSGVSYTNFLLPDWMPMVAKIFAAVSLVGFAVAVVGAKYRENGQRPTVMFILPIVSLVAWWLPSVLQQDFYGYLVPFFHSLQYLCFVKKSEEVAWTEQGVFAASTAKKSSHYIAFFLGLVLTGWLSFECLPAMFDSPSAPMSVPGLGFFFIAAGLFINIHHYFIDNVLWRFQTSSVAKRLVA